MLSISELRQNIFDCEEYYAPCVLKKDLAQFTADRYKKSHIDVAKQKKAAEAYHKLFEDYVEENKQSLYGIYQNSFLGEGNAPIIFGNRELQTKALQRNYGILNEHNRGSIPIFEHWNELKNDLMILGAIQAHRVCRLQWQQGKNAFWDDAHSRPRIVAREMQLLLTFGYEVRPSTPTLGFVLTNPSQNTEFSLKQFPSALDDLDRKSRYLMNIFQRSLL